MEMAVIGINYNETDPSTYKNVEISRIGVNNESKKFSTGDFVKDWYDLMYYIIHSDISETDFIMNSSSVDHFFMDGAKYDNAYLKTDDHNNPYLDYECDHVNQGIEFFVPKGERPTWEEYKERYGE